MSQQLYDPELYFNGNTSFHAADTEPELTLEQREQRWKERRWLDEPKVIADDWLFSPLPSGEFDEF